MANKAKGEYTLTIEDQTYTLVFDLDAMEAMEEHFDQDWPEVQNKLARNSMRATRVMLWAMFRLHHPDITLEQSKKLINKAGGLSKVGEIIAGGLRSLMPDPDDAKALATGVSPDPQSAQAGVGSDSSATPVASA